MTGESGVFYNSVVIRAVLSILRYLKNAYYESGTAHTVARLAGALKRLFVYSRIWCAVRKSERSTNFWENSVFFRIIQRVNNAIVFVIRKLFRVIGAAYRDSFSGRLLHAVTARFAVVISVFIFIITVVPYDRWYNVYGLALMVLIVLLYLIKTGEDDRFGLDVKRVDFAFVLFAGVCLLAALTSISIKSSFKSFVFEAIAFLIVFVMANAIRTKQGLDVIIYGIIAAITVTSLYGLWQYVNHIPVNILWVDTTYSAGVTRVFSTMGNPNNYAEYLLLTIPFYGAAFFNARKNSLKMIIALLALLPLSNLVLTNSRGCWIGFIVSVLVYIFLKDRRLIPIILVLGILMIPLVPASITERLSTIGKDTSSLMRVPIWKAALNMLKDYWATGIGLGSAPFMKLFQNYNTTLTPPAHAHMLPLMLWLETGIAGFAAFFWMIIRIVKKSFISIFGKKDKHLNNVMASCAAALAGIFTAGMIEYVWFYQRGMYMFWIVIGILFIALNIQREETETCERQR